ncbi:MAG TPA: LapA family protein [Methylovirgula sp.]|nr:LapA family protein [Methylovirgula sp.]
MRRALQLIVLIPLAAIGLALAVANRHNVTVSFDPFSSDATGEVVAPLFVVLIVALMLGVVVGSLATWVTQGRHRRALRDLRAEAGRLREEAHHMKVG